MTTRLRPNRDSDTPPSIMFIQSLMEPCNGDYELVCDWCNRLHLCPDYAPSQFMDDDDYEDTKLAHQQSCLTEYSNDPVGVVLHRDVTRLEGVWINGNFFVLYCPCNGLHRYEEFIWEHRNTCDEYIKTRRAQEQQWAKESAVFNKILTGK